MLNINNYYDKYIKYKLKYLKLIKNNTIMIGGAEIFAKYEEKSMKLEIDVNTSMPNIINNIKHRFKKRFIILQVNGQIIYRPCNFQHPVTLTYPNIVDYKKNINDMWEYSVDATDPVKILNITTNDELLRHGITVLDGAKDIVDMYIEYIGYWKTQMHLPIRTPYPLIRSHRSTLNLYEHINFPIKLTDSDLLSDNNNITRIINEIESYSNIEDKIEYYGETVAFLLDPNRAVDSIKEIIRMCPFAFKGYPDVNPDIIETFFISLYSNQEYLKPFNNQPNAFNYFNNYLLEAVFRFRTVDDRDAGFTPVIIPKNCLMNINVIKNIIKIIKETADENVKKVQVIILVYACALNTIEHVRTELQDEIKSIDNQLIDSGTQLINRDKLNIYRRQSLRVMINSALGLPPPERLPPPPPPRALSREQVLRVGTPQKDSGQY